MVISVSRNECDADGTLLKQADRCRGLSVGRIHIDTLCSFKLWNRAETGASDDSNETFLPAGVRLLGPPGGETR